MPVSYSAQLGAALAMKEQKLRPSVRLSFVVMRSFYSLYSKESADKSIIFETVANKKEHFIKALDFSAELARQSRQRLTLVKMGVDPYYETEIKDKFENYKFPLDIRQITAAELLWELTADPGLHDVILAPFIEGELLHAQATALISAHQVCFKRYIGKPCLYMPLSPVSYGLAGTGFACPAGAILAAAAIMEDLGHKNYAFEIRKGVFTVLGQGYKTADIASSGDKTVSTEEFTDLAICEILR